MVDLEQFVSYGTSRLITLEHQELKKVLAYFDALQG